MERIQPGSEDRVVFVGDLVARGPDTPSVLRYARELGALSVRGNHEHRMLLAHRARKENKRGPRLGPSHQRLLHELSEEDWQQLEALPLHLEFPDHGVLVVHAGVQPGVPLEEQQAWALMHMRSLTRHGAPSDRYSPTSWAAHYHEGPHVVYGHNAQAGLELHDNATGLDSGCCYGGRLSALVLKQGQAPPPTAERGDCIVSVPAYERYMPTGGPVSR